MRWRGIGLGVAAALAGLWVFGPYEKVSPPQRFDPVVLEQGVSQYLANAEARVENLREGSAKHVVWAGVPDHQTEWAVVYFHGFSADLNELRPIPEALAGALGANLFYARFAGHGRDGAAMAEARAATWMSEVDEAMAIGRRIGRNVLLLSTSTGGALATLAAADPDMSVGLKGLAFVSPNFEVKNPMAALLTLPAARHWVALVGGAERGFTPVSPEHAAAWTETYPTVATVPMAAVVKAARNLDHSGIQLPAMFIYLPSDKVVNAQATDRVKNDWGGDTRVFHPVLGPNDDASHHVIGGNILSPDATPSIIEALIDWSAEVVAEAGQ